MKERWVRPESGKKGEAHRLGRRYIRAFEALFFKIAELSRSNGHPPDDNYYFSVPAVDGRDFQGLSGIHINPTSLDEEGNPNDLILDLDYEGTRIQQSVAHATWEDGIPILTSVETALIEGNKLYLPPDVAYLARDILIAHGNNASSQTHPAPMVH